MFFFAAFGGSIFAAIDSGGGLSALGGGANHSSIGGGFDTSASATGLIEILYPEIPAGSDADANGLPDAWEMQHFGATGAITTADADGDGTTNLMEYLAATDPQWDFRISPLLARGVWQAHSHRADRLRPKLPRVGHFQFARHLDCPRHDLGRRLDHRLGIPPEPVATLLSENRNPDPNELKPPP